MIQLQSKRFQINLDIKSKAGRIIHKRIIEYFKVYQEIETVRQIIDVQIGNVIRATLLEQSIKSNRTTHKQFS